MHGSANLVALHGSNCTNECWKMCCLGEHVDHSATFNEVTVANAAEILTEKKDLLNDFKKLFEKMRKTPSTLLLSASMNVFHLDVFKFKDHEELLQFFCDRMKCFGDYFLDLKVMRCVFSSEYVKKCDNFERRFDRYILHVVYAYHAQMSPDIKDGNSLIEFILDLDKEDYNLAHVRKFIRQISKDFSIPHESMVIKYSGEGTQVISMQIPKNYMISLVFAPFFSNKITALKYERVQFLMINKEHKMFLAKWNILDSEAVSFGETIFCNGRNKIVSVKINDDVCIGLEYSDASDESVQDEGYIKFLESILNHNRKNIPAIKGLYYSNSNLQYPLLIMEKCEFVKFRFPESEAMQASFLLDIVNCIIEFESPDQTISIKVHSDVVAICQLKAKVCPLYGYSFTVDHESSDRQSKQLPLDDLRWMADITKYLQFGNCTQELPEGHVMKKLLAQKWLSGEDCFRPRSFKELCEDLQDLHGK